ncbi:MAG: hypothetical protein ACJ75Z_00440 [Solirubrobacterales bacterium]
MDVRAAAKTRSRRIATAVTALVIALAAAAPAQGGQMHTGLRAAAIKKCKQKHAPGPRRTACLVKANHQPQ